MKKGKKFLAMFMVLIMCLSFNSVVFADDGIPAGVEKHTITIDVPAAPTEDEEPGIQPQMWGQQTPGVSGNSQINTGTFPIEHRYFAYEMTATDTNGNAVSGTYAVRLINAITSTTVTSMNQNIDGITYKNDWITVEAGLSYHFRIINQSSTSISVTLTYYSWA